jgi:hypothetical protein
MKWIVWIVLAGCQSKSGDAKAKAPPTGSDIVIQLPKAPLTAEYKQDITNLCEVLKLSGADQLPAGDRAPTIAMWLGPNIHTDAGHEFLIAIQPLTGEPKAAALDFEARRVGLDSCTLAAEWRH